ncbi:hypothetical protein [Puniceibacterium sediminis]|uniref:5-bromo-4-chloroindolyl phosphate hydrolysis protein n=1 Tax=Puniceibacterium sediminis TaxID=1608407 RepID=A0A238Z0G6_9RHOB|nr:hypothetical protein [Puniceibacterium sediminis]SNR76403.1 hypothetical protein SAMN06265370_12164 [Puniceibacterium sediminis]
MIRSFTKPCEYKGQIPPLSLLFVSACPLFVWVLHASVSGIFLAFGFLTLFTLALGLIAEGSCREAAYDAAEVARKPRLPRKLLGSVIISALVLAMGVLKFSEIMPAVACGALAMGLCVLAFGVDPMNDKGVETPDYLLRQRVQDLTNYTERTLDELVLRIHHLDDSDLSRRTEAVRSAVNRLVRTLSQDPIAIQSVRKPLMKFLHMSAHEADRLDESWNSACRNFARQRYINQLSTMATVFESRARHQGLATRNDSFELEAELLIDRMKHENAA